jgi:hypothetical protein
LQHILPHEWPVKSDHVRHKHRGEADDYHDVLREFQINPSFNVLQNYGSGTQPLLYYVFDVMVLDGRDVMSEPLTMRRELLKRRLLPTLAEPICESSILEAALDDQRTTEPAK